MGFVSSQKTRCESHYCRPKESLDGLMTPSGCLGINRNAECQRQIERVRSADVTHFIVVVPFSVGRFHNITLYRQHNNSLFTRL